jgi:hypothetical protein
MRWYFTVRSNHTPAGVQTQRTAADRTVTAVGTCALNAGWRECSARSPAAVMAAICAERVVTARREVPPHVALRIVMQAALSMALVEPRLIRGAASKSE